MRLSFGLLPLLLSACADGDGDGAPDTIDCNPTDPAIYPGAPEPDCTDPVDYDCDGSVAYADLDADGFAACVDCDDTNPAMNPAAPEDVGAAMAGTGNGIDDDCDGLVDEGLPYGNGQDGTVYVAVDSTFRDIGGACTPVSVIGADTVEVADASSFAPGDKALLMTMQYDPTVAPSAAVGTWELFDIAAVGAADVTFASPIVRIYGDGSNTALTGVTVALYRVPQLHGLGVMPSVTLSADPWDGTCGGVLAAVSDLYVSARGTFSAAGAGYRGGAATSVATASEVAGWQGEGPAGQGTRSPDENSGGGGGGGLAAECPNCEGNGGGGAHGGPGRDGSVINPAFGDLGMGGFFYGDSTLSALTMGAGGGAGAIDRVVEEGTAGAGGAGGGIVFLAAPRTYIPGWVDASGADGQAPCAGPAMEACSTTGHQPSDMSEAGAGGGGAGGTVYLITDELSLYFPHLVAVGGLGAEALSTPGFFAGDGGLGLVRLDTASINGWDFVDPQHGIDAETYCEPDPFLVDLDP